ncbi:MAG: hypothetical protein AAFP19_10375 [Bacteroidota bacterium]
MYRFVFLLSLFMLLQHNSLARHPQMLGKSSSNNPGDPEKVRLSAGIKLAYFWNRKMTSVYTLSVALGASKSFYFGEASSPFRLIPSYQLTFNTYYNGLGNNMLPVFAKVQMDLINSFALTTGIKEGNSEMLTEVRTFNNMTVTPIEHDLHWSLTLASNFIANNHGRNQTVGSIGLNFWKMVQVGYYNDATPFEVLGLGDGFDRWWTGGGYGVLNVERLADRVFKEQGEAFEWRLQFFSFERFTGDVQDAYIISNYLSMSYVPSNKQMDNFFNRSQMSFSAKHSSGWEVQLRLLGQYKNDIQDLIHLKKGYPLHYSYARQRTLIGAGRNFYTRFKL